MTKMSLNLNPYLTLVEQGSDPSTPGATHQLLYAKSGGLYVINSAAAVTGPFGAGASAGALVLLEQHTASTSATLDFTTAISATYDEYLLEGVTLAPVTNGDALWLRVGTGGGPTYDGGSNYYPALTGYASDTTTSAVAANPGTAIIIAKAVSNGAAYGHCSFSFRITAPGSGSLNKMAWGTSVCHSGTAVVPAIGGGLWASTTAITALRIMFSSGNIASGTVRVYGIAKS
jgi:hypothetical protein